MQNIEKWQSARATVVHFKMFRPIITDCDAIKQVQTSCGPETPFFYGLYMLCWSFLFKRLCGVKFFNRDVFL